MNRVLLTHEEESIIAQATPKGSGAIALIRISGVDSFHIISKITNTPITKLPSHTIHFGYVKDNQNQKVDQVMFLIMKAPKTFTGQDTIEITCHNNQFIIEKIIRLAIENGARPAQRGEFTKRAFLNNKIDLPQAEAINELISAKTSLAIKNSLSQVEGSLSYWLNNIETDLIKILAYSEGSLEFVEEGINFNNDIKTLLKKTLKKIAGIKKNFNQQRQIRTGFRVALIGSTNAGKSSLFNILIDKKRAIVTNIKGTTRDVIESGIYKNGIFITFIDTAGIRVSKNQIEKEGVKKSFEEAKSADIILLITDASKKLTKKEEKDYDALIKKYKKKIILVENKSDLAKKNFYLKGLAVSSKKGTNIDALKDLIEKKIEQQLKTVDSQFLINQRQFNLILALEKDLEKIIQRPMEYELLAYDITDAISKISELSGKTITQNSMDLIFKKFCIGK